MSAKLQWVIIAFFAGGTVLAVFLAMARGPFAIFDEVYLVMTLVLPAVLVPLTLIVVQWRRPKAGWLSTVAAVLAAGGVSCAHLAFVAAMSAGV